jgi:hypothetical protein
MSDFLQAVTQAFKSLLARGLLSVESSRYDAQAFGNAVVVLAGRNLRVRVIRDRSETLADAASRLDPDNWFPLQRVIRAVGVSSPPPEGLLTPEQAAEIVARYFTDLEKGLGNGQFDQTKTVLADLERFAVKRLLDRAKGSAK